LEEDRKAIQKKCEAYKRHPDCRYVLTIESSRIEVSVWFSGIGFWTEHRLTNPGDELVPENFGLRCRLRDLYRGTALQPRPTP